MQIVWVFVFEPRAWCEYFVFCFVSSRGSCANRLGFCFWPGALGFGHAGACQGDGVSGLEAAELGLAAVCPGLGSREAGADCLGFCCPGVVRIV